jgi:hypothetical protein
MMGIIGSPPVGPRGEAAFLVIARRPDASPRTRLQ